MKDRGKAGQKEGQREGRTDRGKQDGQTEGSTAVLQAPGGSGRWATLGVGGIGGGCSVCDRVA